MRNFVWTLGILWAPLLQAQYVQAPSGYTIEYSHYDGFGKKMRRETVYEMPASGQIGKPIQTRIYLDETNELREASFLQENGKWASYGSGNLPAQLKEQIGYANRIALRRFRGNNH